MRARGDRGWLVGWAVAQRVGDDVDQHPFQQARVGGGGRQVGRDVSGDGRGRRAKFVQRQGYGVLQSDRGSGDAEDAGLESTHVQEVGDQPGEAVQRLLGGLQQLLSVGLVELDVVAAQTGDGCLRRRQRRTQVVADRGEQRGAHAVCRGEGLGGGGFLGEPFLAQRDGGLGGERLDDPPVGGLQSAAAEHDGDPVVDGYRRLAAVGRAGRLLADTGHDAPGVLLAGPVGTATGLLGQLQHAHRAQPECFPELVQQGGQRAFAAQDATGNGREGLRVGGGAGGLAGTPGGHVDDPAHRQRHADEDGQGEQVVRLGDCQRAVGRCEEPVEQQRAAQRGDKRRPHATDECDPDDSGEEQQDVVGERQVGQRPQQQGEQGHAQRGQDEAEQPPASGQRGRHRCRPSALACLLVGDKVHVDRPGERGGCHPDAPGEDLRETPTPAGAEHQLGGVHALGEIQQRGRHVGAEHLVVGAAEALHEHPLAGELGRVRAGQAVAAGDVHGEQVGTLAAGGDAGGAADQRLALRAAGKRHHHTFPGLPGRGDALLAAVHLKLLVDLVGQPEQRQLAQRGEVADPEVVAERGVDLVGAVDIAVRHPAAQRLGCHVDKLDLLGGADDLVRHRLPLGGAGDLRDDVVHRLQVLHVDRGQHVDARVEQFLDVLPALVVPRAGHVRVCQLVDHSDLRPAGQHRVQVHLGELGAPVGHRAAGHLLQFADHGGGLLPAVGLHEADHHVGAARGSPLGLLQHGVRLADARGGSEVDAQFSAWHGTILSDQKERPLLNARR